MNQTPREHVKPYLWKIGDDGRTAIIGHNGMWQVLVACDIYATLLEASRRMAEIESAFDHDAPDRPAYLTDLLFAVEHALPFIRAIAPAPIVSNLEQAIEKARK